MRKIIGFDLRKNPPGFSVQSVDPEIWETLLPSELESRLSLGLGTSCPQHLSETMRPFKTLGLNAETMPSTLAICVDNDVEGDFIGLTSDDEGETLKSVIDPGSWKLLGFDVANRFLTSAISNELNPQRLSEEIMQLYLKVDSVTKLFDSLSIATEFCDLTNTTRKPRWRWYVMSIYLLDDEIATASKHQMISG